ncbi:spliceosome-associated protein CWC27 homolog isoform X3 [Convolutriloba macropyga]
MEGYYNDTFFHRLVPGFLVQGGDPSGSGDGGESIYGKPFKDEFHQRLKFERRGLVGMASVEPNSNSSQFFFTLDAAPELTNKNTLFGKVSGNTLYNMLSLGETGVEEDGRPSKKNYIFRTEILNNPFDDIEPREHVAVAKSSSKPEKKEKTKSKVQAVKNFNLLSFGDEAEEDEDEIDSQSAGNIFKGSAHDLLHNDPKLIQSASKVSDGYENNAKSTKKHDIDKSEDNENQGSVKRKKTQSNQSTKMKAAVGSDDVSENERSSGNDEETEQTDKLSKLRAESEQLKNELNLVTSKKQNKEKKKEAKDQENIDDMYSVAYMKKYRHLKTRSSKTQAEKAAKQDTTMKMLAEFEAKLNAANRLNLASKYEDEDDEEDGKSASDLSEAVATNSSSSAWMTHTFQPDADGFKQARDANVERADEEYEIFDPRNPMNKRRRLNEAKRAKDKNRPLAGVKDLD